MCRVPCAGCCLSGSWVLVPLSQAGGSPQPLSPSLPPVRVVFVLPLPWPGCSHSLLFLSGVLSSLVPALSVRGLSSVSVFSAFVVSFFFFYTLFISLWLHISLLGVFLYNSVLSLSTFVLCPFLSLFSCLTSLWPSQLVSLACSSLYPTHTALGPLGAPDPASLMMG